ncbi:MAG TPA: DUF4198 domain-containing protein [Terriglobales bacterium]|nr:DUF4198 domain-containing protein [Terriglobales bacterium]
MRILAAVILFTSTALAHDLFLVPVGQGKDRKICVRVGEHFPASQNAMPLNRAGIFQARYGGIQKLADKLQVDEAAKQTCAPLPASAPTGIDSATGSISGIVEITVNPVFIRLAAKDFNGYIEGEGFAKVIAARKQSGQEQSEGRELYSRYAKLILPNAQGVDKPLGHTLEIVPDSPRVGRLGFSKIATEPGIQNLSVRVLFKGKPLVGVRLSAMYAGYHAPKGTDPHALPVNSTTDADGRAILKLDRPGMWYARLIYMEPAMNDPEVDWRSYFATLTFEVPHD